MIVIIDGHGLAYRNYYGLKKTNLKTRDGKPTFAIYGFIKSIIETIKRYKPTKICIVFDKAKKTFRTELFQDYKANRKEMPDDLRYQLSIIHQLIEVLGIDIYEKEGYEADDIIGTLINKFFYKEKVIILTGDKDLLQLVNDNTKVIMVKPLTSELKVYDYSTVINELELEPYQIPHLKALAGDTSDNIPGVKGIGEKIAKELIKQFKTVDNIINSLDKIEPLKVRTLICSDIDNLKLSYNLALIDTNVPLELNDSYKNFNQQELIKLLKELEFVSILKELPVILEILGNFEINNSLKLPNFDIKFINNHLELEELAQNLLKVKYFAIALNTTNNKPFETEILGISIAYEDFNNFEILTLFDNLENKNKVNNFYIKINPNLPIDIVTNTLKPLLESDKILKIGHNLKFIINVFSRYNIRFNGILHDTLILDYLINPESNHNLKELAFSYLGYNIKDNDLCDNDICINTSINIELVKVLIKKLKELELEELYKNVEIPLIYVLANMEQEGICIDLPYINELSKKIENNLKLLEEEIFKLVGFKFNINSPKQLSDILFNKLNLPTKGLKKTSQGFSTDISNLEKLKKCSPIIEYILDYRQLIKLKNTYIDTLPKFLNPFTNKIHSSFNQTITATGRLSSSEPNLQNIPIKTELGKDIRKAFIPSNSNNYILSADYSQIELRILAHFSQDPNFIQAFLNDIDIHSLTASYIFKIPINEVTIEQRSKAKQVNFGIVYGQTPYGLSEVLSISNEEAKELINNFYNNYVQVKNYFEQVIKEAKELGYVKTILNRKRFLPDICSQDKTKRELAERIAINTTIQGSAADIIKIAMIKLYNTLQEKSLSSKLLLQVHDELVLECPKDELEAIIEIVKNTMENPISLTVPLKVNVSYGKSWKIS